MLLFSGSLARSGSFYHPHARMHLHARAHTLTHTHTQARTHIHTHTQARTHIHTRRHPHAHARTYQRSKVALIWVGCFFQMKSYHPFMIKQEDTSKQPRSDSRQPKRKQKLKQKKRKKTDGPARCSLLTRSLCCVSQQK